MADPFIGIDVAGLERMTSKLDGLYNELADAGVESANDYLIEVVKKESRPAYSLEPFFWSSDKQLRYVMMLLRAQGGPPYVRTHQLRDGWQLLGYGRNQIIVNEVPYAQYVKQQSTQITGHKFRDWDVIEQDVESHKSQITKEFDEGVRDAIEKSGLA